jgi:hypothetical protein
VDGSSFENAVYLALIRSTDLLTNDLAYWLCTYTPLDGGACGRLGVG